MSFKELSDFLDEALRLPIRGKTYVIEPCDAETGLMCQRLLGLAAKAVGGTEVTDEDAKKVQLDDDDERDLYQRLLGNVWDEMFSDGLPWRVIQKAGTTALLWTVYGDEQAESYWNGSGKAKAPEDRKAPRKKSTARQASPNSSKTPKSLDIPGPKSSNTGD